MGFQTPISISDVIARIDERKLLLPAIQREFVWAPYKIEWLFDSLLQDYPIGSFLFWSVREASSKENFRYYEFLREYREFFQTHNPEFTTHGHVDFDAVLDGQQRLTALYIGLKGTYAYKRPRLWWENNERAIPTRRLYLNIAEPAPEDDDEPGRIFEFRFLTDDEFNQDNDKWFLVGRILAVSGLFELNKLLSEGGYANSEFCARALSRLHQVVHIDRVINYYSVAHVDMDAALNVFVRVNSGGEPLSLSDMLMSTAIANWKARDARKEILGLVDDVGTKGFRITKDFVLKACLYLYSSDIRYRASNFSANQVRPFEQHWDSIRTSILAGFDLASDFGYSERSLISKNALLPIIYWVHHTGISSKFVTQVALRAQRDIMRRWLHGVILKGIFGSSADTILTMIRRVVIGGEFGNQFVMAGLTEFPAQGISSILRAQGKDPAITEDFIDSLLLTQYDERYAFTLLALLAPNLDYKNGDFHADHMHPASSFKKRSDLTTAGIDSTDIPFYQDPRNWNSILNLRHLDSSENISKQDTSLVDWATREAGRQQISIAKFCGDHHLPGSDLLSFSRFPDFIGERRKLLSAELSRLL